VKTGPREFFGCQTAPGYHLHGTVGLHAVV